MGLDNVELVCADIASLDLTALGQFDFIICHGVYSWVSGVVQDAILSACGRLLAPTGVAYIGYNTYPGWKAREIVRDAMLLSVGDRPTVEEKVRRARGVVDFLEKVAQPDSVLARALRDYRLMNGAAGDYYLLHEELEIFNSPCYFRDFVARARVHGLEYLTEAQPEYTFAINYGPIVADHLLEYADDQILLEQHLDFVVNRHFRQSLLVRLDSAARINRTFDRKRCRRMHFAARLSSDQQFDDPVVNTAIDALADRWPSTLSWRDLIDAVRVRLGVTAPSDIEDRVDTLLECLIIQGQARYRLDPVSPEPACFPVRLNEPARRMAELTRDDAEAFVFNDWHELLPLSPVDRHLLPLLDGGHSRKALIDALMDATGQGLIQIERDDGEALSQGDIRDVLAQQVDALPQRLVEMKLMESCTHTSIPLIANGC